MTSTEFCVYVLSFTLDKNREVLHIFPPPKKKSDREGDESSD